MASGNQELTAGAVGLPQTSGESHERSRSRVVWCAYGAYGVKLANMSHFYPLELGKSIKAQVYYTELYKKNIEKKDQSPWIVSAVANNSLHFSLTVSVVSDAL